MLSERILHLQQESTAASRSSLDSCLAKQLEPVKVTEEASPSPCSSKPAGKSDPKVQHQRFELEKDAFEHVSFCGKPRHRFVLLTILLVELNKEQRVQAYIVRLILEELWNSGAVCATRRSQAQHTWARSSSDIPKHPRLASEWISSVLVSSLALSPSAGAAAAASRTVSWYQGMGIRNCHFRTVTRRDGCGFQNQPWYAK